jgi:hypothetical protein
MQNAISFFEKCNIIFGALQKWFSIRLFELTILYSLMKYIGTSRHTVFVVRYDTMQNCL